ncbi:hypothetical protein JOC36_000030 [Weissella uvarum]|uniref:DUF2785 domain-containing protein n=1 Tax=Weissella uvarum TaxID=1479233 RepID=UPI00195F9881|nr:DUF2785 domain-containing protein [Weissella uvarum]MBM7616497.1 hypothetical protein [Weissella uvarum]MCM0595042.1 DUF2785 domain-containing protein [Weissella uvarum]
MSAQKQNQVQRELHALHQAFRAGDVYESLGPKIGEIIDSQPALEVPTPVEQLSTDEVAEMLETSTVLQQQLLAGDLQTVSNEQLIQLVNALGQIDPRVREDAALKTLVLLIQDQVLSMDQLVTVRMHILRPEVLFYHIREHANAGVFLRSYNLCLLSVMKLWEQPLPMDAPDYQEMVELLATYIVQENDTRGFVDQQGWVNAYVHIAHLLDAFNFDNDMLRLDKIFLLTTFLESYRRLATPLVMGEEKHIALYLTNLLNLDSIYVNNFLMQVKRIRRELVQQGEPQDEAGWHRWHNQRRLYEALLAQPKLPENVSNYLKNMNFF